MFKMIFLGFFTLLNAYFAFFDGKFIPLDMLNFIATIICCYAFVVNYQAYKHRSLNVHK